MFAFFAFNPVLAQDNAPPSTIGLEVVAEGLTAPLDLEQPNDGSGRMFIVDQIGVIHVIDSDGQLLDEPFLDVRDRMVELSDSYDERGLLGLALHPDFANNGRLFVYYNAPLREEGPEEWNNTSHVSEFTVSSDNANQVDMDSETVLLMVDQPQMNHEGGDIVFGPDGYLYVPLGDGGGADDTGMGHTEGMGNGQDLSTMLGKILRIDVDNGDPYAIPDDNPFVDNADALDEIWAYGFRNPWRVSFDEEHGLIAADLGQNVWEEVHVVEAGGNYGWNVMEGSHCFSTETPNYNPLECDMSAANGDALQLPVVEYNHQVGISIIGGYVYRGSAMPTGMQGAYVFADWSTSFAAPHGQIFAATMAPEGADEKMWKMQTLTVANSGNAYLDSYILALGEDNNGELYILSSDTAGPSGETGQVRRIVPADSILSDG
ncbi:MAG: hypothetical protein CL607_18820 [Anaerolineaceae bacterium]|nr:hypothetical protein [Anaerolineaceae bacterium]